MKLKNVSKAFLPVIKFFAPIILGLCFIVFLATLVEENIWMSLWPLLLAYFFPPFGKESVIPLGVGVLEKGLTIPFINLHVNPVSINPILMALSVAFIDIIIALFLVWNYDLAKEIPIVGIFIMKIEEKGRGSEKKYRWVKPLRFVGIMLFVMIPFQGSGGLVGSIVGRLIGMKPWNTFFAISIGAVVGCLLIAFFAKMFLIFVEINTILTFILIAVIVILITLYYFFYQRRKRE